MAQAAAAAPPACPKTGWKNSWKSSPSCNLTSAEFLASVRAVNQIYPSWRGQKSCVMQTQTLSFALTWFLAGKDVSGEPQMFISFALG